MGCVTYRLLPINSNREPQAVPAWLNRSRRVKTRWVVFVRLGINPAAHVREGILCVTTFAGGPRFTSKACKSAPQAGAERCRLLQASQRVGTLAHYCVNFSHLPMGRFTAVAPLAAVYLQVIADGVSGERWRESRGFRREAQRLGL